MIVQLQLWLNSTFHNIYRLKLVIMEWFPNLMWPVAYCPTVWLLPFIKQSTALVGMCKQVFVSPTEEYFFTHKLSSPNYLDVNVHMTFCDDYTSH